MAPTTGRARAARGSAAAVMCLLLSASGHAAAGGALPELGTLLALGALLAALMIALAGRRRGLPTLVALVGGSQLVLHGALELIGDATHVHTHHGHAIADPMLAPVLMTAAHGLAAVATSVLLAGAERTMFVLAAGMAVVLPRPPDPLPVRGRPARVVVPAGHVDPGAWRVPPRRLHCRRGPPTVIAHLVHP